MTPLYGYRCGRCDNRFERTRAMDDRHTASCPQCGLLAVIVPSPVNHTFGWRLTEASHERWATDQYERDI